MKTAYIMRGLPGAGKSSIVTSLECIGLGDACWCSADNFFMKDGKYQWYAAGLKQAHQECRDYFHRACKAGAQLVVCDNTNIKHADYKYYIQTAKEFGYQVVVITVGQFDKESLKLYAERNSHGVPLETIERMAAKFQL